MSKYTTDRNYIYYESTNIPKNKLDIRDLQALEELERKLLLKGYEYFHKNLSKNTIFDEEYLLKLHGKTFGELYDFAGKFREINISKGYSTFCQVRFLKEASNEIFRKLQNDGYLKDYAKKPKEEFAKKLAYYTCELIALHPFLELNGRIIRLFLDMIAIYNGYEYIDYENALKIIGDDNKYILASIDCISSGESLMYDIILDGLKKAE